MIIDKSKAYRTKSGREVRIYATDGKYERPIHGAVNENGWLLMRWFEDGHLNSSGHSSESDLVEADPHGILQRHRELLAEALERLSYYTDATAIREAQLNNLVPSAQAALIALAKLDAEKSK